MITNSNPKSEKEVIATDTEDPEQDDTMKPKARDRTPSIVVGMPIEVAGFSDTGQTVEPASKPIDDSEDSQGSLSSLQNPSPTSSSTVNTKPPQPNLHGNNRRLSLNIGKTAPRRLSLTVEGLASAYETQANYPGGNATGSLRNKVALKPGHSLMGWTKLASTAKDLSGTNGKLLEVSPEELAKHDKEEDCWVALKGNVYNVTTYLQYHPGGVEELMRGAGADATELFNEVHRWVNYESILAKCLVGRYKLDSPATPVGRASFETPVSPDSAGEGDMRDKMKGVFAGIITEIDKQVLAVSESQCELDSQLDRLISTLDNIKIDDKLTDEISANAKRIASLKSRLTLINTILSNSSARCSKTLAACGAALDSLEPRKGAAGN